jgi:hypothetical protein
MDVAEPRVRHRGFFLHSPTGEVDSAEHENPEGVVVRVRSARPTVARHVANASSGGRSRTNQRNDGTQPEIRSGSVTGSRQRGHLPR